MQYEENPEDKRYMELLVINEKKLKIMMTEDDMDAYALRAAEVTPEDAHARQVFWHILAEAKTKTGFDTSGERIYVQLYPSKEGGCEVFITKLGILAHEKKTEGGEEMLKERRIYDLSEESRPSYYRFAELCDLLAACRMLRETDYDGKSAAFSENKQGPFYLMVEDESPAVPEFFGKLCKPCVADYITEHCRCISENAVCQLGTLSS